MEPGIVISSIAPSIGTMAKLGFYLIAAIYIIFSAIMYYHWNEYSGNAKVSRLTLITYLSTTVPLIGALFYSAFII